MLHPLRMRAKRTAHNIIRIATSARKHKQVISTFAEKHGLVYFGSVDQLSDNHDFIRGFTSSLSHLDSHYCVGTVDEYDVKLTDRNDAVWQPDGSIAIFNWLIMTVDLHTERNIPHFFINAKRHHSKAYDMLFTTHTTLKEVRMGSFEEYGADFLNRFSVYSRATDSLEIERLMPSDTARVFGAHFWPLSVECLNGILYLYFDSKGRLMPHHLNTILEDGLWLARHLDNQIENV